MLRSFGHTEWESTQEILGSTINVEKDAQYGLPNNVEKVEKRLEG